MAKYGNIKLGAYDRIWSDTDKKYLQAFIDNSAMLQVKYRFAYNHFSIAGSTLPTGSHGEAIFRIAAKTTRPDEMADFRAPLSSTTQMDRTGFADFMGTIPEIGKGFMEKHTERYQKEQIVKQFGTDSITNELIKNYIVDLQALKNTVDLRLSNMAAQIMSTAAIKGVNADNENVIWYNLKAPVPAANFVNAGEKVWTDADCDLIEQMYKIENDFRERTGYDGAMKWNITLNMWRNVFLKNAKLRDDVINYRKVAEKPYSLGSTLSEDWVNEYLNVLGLISPIQVIEEGEILGGVTVRKSVKGWEDDIAVLRPMGEAGQIQHTGVLDAIFAERYKSPVVERQTASVGDSGIMTLITSTVDNAGYPEWHTDLFCAAVPALTEYPYHVIIKTSVAG